MAEISKLNTIKPLQTTEVDQKAKNKATEEKFKEVSDLYEKYFIREMMKQMRSTVQESGFIKQNNAEKIFRDQLDDQYADQWGKAGGVGYSKIIYDQLMQKYGEQMGLKDRIEKPHGPIEMNNKSLYSGIVSQTHPTENNLDLQMQKQQKILEPTTFKFENLSNQKSELKNPWVGTLLDKKYLEMDQMQYHIKHDNGLESLIMTRGSGLGADQQLSQGDTIQAGQQLGWVSAASPLFWTVKKNVSE